MGKFDEETAWTKQVTTEPAENNLRRNPDPCPTPLSEPSGFQPEGRDLPIPTQLAPLWVPVRGTSEGGQSLPIPTQLAQLHVPSNRGRSEGRQSTPNTAVRQPEGECDPESSLPCSCPKRQFMEPPDTLPVPATASSRGALKDFIMDWYAASVFNVCKRQAWPRT